MPELKLTIQRYPKDAVVFVEGSKDIENFYIIKEGKVKLTRINEVVEDPSLTVLSTGDCFGVVSSMTKRPQIETVTALTDLILINIKSSQFIDLIKANAPIALKIIKYFSRKLRIFDADIARLTLKKPIDEDPSLIYEIGEYYYKKNEYLTAYSVFNKFIRYVPHDVRVLDAQEKLNIIAQELKNIVEFEQIGPFTRKYLNGAMVFCEHEKGDELYIIQEGKIKITKIAGNKEVLLSILNPGDILGEMAIIEDKPRSASAVAFGDVIVYVISKDNFIKIVPENPSLIFKIITVLSERIWTAYRQLENLAIKDDYARLLDMILLRVETKRVRIAPKVSYNLEIGESELIDMLGFSPEKGAILINRLLQDKNYKISDQKIVIEDLGELLKQAEGAKFRTRTIQK